MTSDGSERPLVSVVVEGYNELKLAASVTDVLDGLRRQDYPLERVELILVGSEAQYRQWRDLTSGERCFHRVLIVEAEGKLYYELKNLGAARASGEIVAFIDSDIDPHPGWLSAIVAAIEGGADATAGVSTFRDRSGWRTPRALLHAAASVSFAHVVGRRGGSATFPAAGLLGHNLAGRAETLRSIPFRTRPFARNCSIALLYQDLRAAGARVDLVPGARVEHSFSPGWFVYPFHIRVGWEEYTLRRLSPAMPNGSLRRTGPLEPLLTMLWYVCLDLRAWHRFSRALGQGVVRRWARWPLVLIPSIVARGAGMIGGYAAILFPGRARAWAEAQ
jgi:glycosyltransferase involved in cell wall biosynthesis